MTSLDFSEASKQAVHSQLRDWGFDPDSIESKISEFQDLLFQKFQGAAYGVESAILADKQIRLSHEIENPTEAKQNCAEIGIRLMEYYAAVGLEDQAKLMMFYFHESEIAHMALLHFDRPNENPWMIDPLFGHMGRITINQKGAILSPNDSTSKKHLKYSQIVLLDSKEVVEYINFMNSDEGFFRYFENGQKIHEERYEGFSAEYIIKTSSNKLQVQTTFLDDLFDFFTLQRTYQFENGTIKHSDELIIHLGYGWLPERVIYSSQNGINQELDMQKLTQREINISVAFFDYWNRFIEQDESIHSIEELQAHNDSFYKHRIEKLTEMYHTIGVDFETIKPFSREERRKLEEEKLEHYDSEVREKFNQLQREVFKVEDICDHLHFNMDSKQRGWHLDISLYLSKFRDRKMIPQKPYGKLRPHKHAEEIFEGYAQHRHGIFKPVIDQFFESDVVKKIVQRYENMMIASQLEQAS